MIFHLFIHTLYKVRINTVSLVIYHMISCESEDYGSIMNYLAHIFLAGTDSEIITGALMGDFLRGVERKMLPEKVQQGITHHLEIDSYTDSHEIVRSLKRLFSDKRRRYSGIILDVTFDHFLYRHWDQFAHESLDHCIERAHRSLLSHQTIMPPRMRRVVRLLIEHDVLHSYRSLEGIGVALDRIDSRIPRETMLYNSIEEIRKNETELEVGFLTFFRELFDQFTLTKKS